MTNETVLITGASGFVGCRLAERLALGTDYQVRAMVRRFSGSGVARLARLPIKLVSADVLDLESLTRAVDNVNIIVHLAYGSRGSKKEKTNITVSGTENVIKAALQASVRKLIYVSTAAVHGQDPKRSVVNESAPFVNTRDVYRSSKIKAEKIIWRYYKEHRLPVVVFRPPLLYGPYGRDWSIRIVEEIKRGAVLTNGGNGAANLVYVDNLIDAFIRAMENDAGDGEAFFVVDDEHLTWKDVYQRYADMVGNHPPFRTMSAEEIMTQRKAIEPTMVGRWFFAPLKVCSTIVRHSLKSDQIRSEIRDIPWIKPLAGLLPKQIKDSLKGNDGRHQDMPGPSRKADSIQLPNKDMVELYSSKSRFSNDKLKRILGHKQRITFDEGIDLTYSWLRYQRLVS